jgi:hypothetical protein
MSGIGPGQSIAANAALPFGAGISSAPHSCARHRNPARPSPWARETLFTSKESFTARTRRGWIPVTGTGMREEERAAPGRNLAYAAALRANFVMLGLDPSIHAQAVASAGWTGQKRGEERRACRSPFSPPGRRWPEGSDEGAARHALFCSSSMLGNCLSHVAQGVAPLHPLIRPDGHLLPAGEKGDVNISPLTGMGAIT